MNWSAAFGATVGSGLDPLLFIPAIFAGWIIRNFAGAALAGLAIAIILIVFYGYAMGNAFALTQEAIFGRVLAVMTITSWTFLVRNWPLTRK